MTVTYDLMHLAFQGDITRVFTFMIGHEGSGRSYAHIGIPEPHHRSRTTATTPERHREVREAGHLSDRSSSPSSSTS